MITEIFLAEDEHKDWKPLNLEIMRRFTLFVPSYSASFAMEFDGRHCESCTTYMVEARPTCVCEKTMFPPTIHPRTESKLKTIEFTPLTI